MILFRKMIISQLELGPPVYEHDGGKQTGN